MKIDIPEKKVLKDENCHLLQFLVFGCGPKSTHLRDLGPFIKVYLKKASSALEWNKKTYSSYNALLGQVYVDKVSNVEECLLG